MAATRISVTRDGRTTVVDVADDLSRATLDRQLHEVKIVSDGGRRVDLEVDGEPVTVEGWPTECPVPPGPVEVNGEDWVVGIEAERNAPRATRAPPPSAAVGDQPTAGPASGGMPVLPPMPGRILEVRVKDGDRVPKGAVLLVLEAMKMRNEVASPTAGVVRDLRVREGSNVRARERMLTVVPESAAPP